MRDAETRFHETWLGMVQPTEGLVVSVPVLVEAQCMARQLPELQERLLDLCPTRPDGGRSITSLPAFFEQILHHPASHFDAGDAIAPDVSLYVPEGHQTIRPTLALRKAPDAGPDATSAPGDATPAARAAWPYVALVWDLPEGLDLDKPETMTGPWAYPPSAKLDRLLRSCHVPIGLLTNRRAVRLVYAPHGESSGSITFRVDDMATVGGRPILDALVMLLSGTRFFSVAEAQSLPAILSESRKRQANVTTELAEQVLEAIQILLRGLEAAAERDGSTLLSEAVERQDDHVYGALLTVLLRLVFVLYAEDWGLLPVESDLWAEHYSALSLFEQLQADRGAYPDSMTRRFGAWSRLVALFRAIFLGVSHGELRLPPRRGQLFNPARFPFLEGWPDAGGAPIADAAARAAVRVPQVDDDIVHRVLEKLVVFQGQRLSYRALDVEQLGSVYEALMGYHVVRLQSDAVALRVKAKSGAARAWIEAKALLAEPSTRRGAWLEDELGFDKATAKKVAEAVKTFGLKQEKEALDALLDVAAGRAKDRERFRAAEGRLVLQPGPERRRTSSHYTPRELSGPIVRRTLEPLLAVMGEKPASERILRLKICDPAMGSGAFLVEACRFLADEVVKAWTREGALPAGDDPTLVARRLVAQRCLYGVDKNAYAVDLAKLSLWLVTLAKDLPFTFLDHALRHGDSLVGLDYEQLRAGHWKVERGLDKAGAQVGLLDGVLREALDEAIAIREGILSLAGDPSLAAQREKERRMDDADDALAHARLLGDLVVGAFFAHEKDKDRERERKDRVEAFVRWKQGGSTDSPEQLLEWKREIRARLPVFHWMLELPEIFHAERPDPLDEDQINRAAYMDAFVGNPPFAGKNAIVQASGPCYLPWLQAVHEGAHGNADLSSHFFRRSAALIGQHGTLGLIATSSIAQGDTRATGLQRLLQNGLIIYEAVSELRWAGEADVFVSVVHVARGNAMKGNTVRRLDGARVAAIDSRLHAGVERLDPVPLAANTACSFQGVILLGMGFILSQEQRDMLVAANPRNIDVLCPFLGGEELNASPTQACQRYVINFGQKSLQEASEWPELLAILEEKVKPEREAQKDALARQYWWKFLRPRPELKTAIAPLRRCLVAARVTKHLSLSFQPIDRILNEKLYVFVFQDFTQFSLLQSRSHEVWARCLSSEFGSSSIGAVLAYAASDCFETFPFPQPDPRTVIPELEDIGQRLYDARAKYMVDENVGLTITYNRLKDPTHRDARVLELRALHEAMDAAVLRAYGWSELATPPYCPATEAEKKAIEVFQSEVLDRLFVLNAKRAEEEKIKGAVAGAKQKGAGKPRGKKATAPAAQQEALFEAPPADQSGGAPPGNGGFRPPSEPANRAAVRSGKKR